MKKENFLFPHSILLAQSILPDEYSPHIEEDIDLIPG